MIHIDASHLEGGGQSPRLALCLSALTLTPIHLTNIRANRASHSNSKRQSKASTTKSSPRKQGGLKESHLAALRFLADACNATVTGDEVGAREVVFKPRRQWCLTLPSSQELGKEWEPGARIELKNPGSVFLIFQALYPYLVFAKRPETARLRNKHEGLDYESQSEAGDEAPIPFELILTGGTNVDKSMSVDYVQQVFLPICKKIGLPDVKVERVKRGWAGSAGKVGEVKISVDIPPSQPASAVNNGGRANGFVLNAFRIEERGDINKVVINVLAPTKEIREEVKAAASQKVTTALGSSTVTVETDVDEDSGHPSRFYTLLVAHTSAGWRIGRDYLGGWRKARNEREAIFMVDKAVTKVVGDLMGEIRGGGCVDEHMQDQLVVFQALAKERSVVRGRDGTGTLHTQTARWVCEEMLGNRGVQFDKDGACEGIGWNTEETPVVGAEKGMQGLKIQDDWEVVEECTS